MKSFFFSFTPFSFTADATTLSARFVLARLWGKLPPQSEEVETEEHKLQSGK